MIMANPAELATCAACGRILPASSTKGRRREYCDATCRSAARRRREADRVKNSLTSVQRQDYLDDMDPPLAALAAARDLAAAAGETLQQAVDKARVAGHSWREIGDVLGTSRQAAFQRFGHPLDPRTGAPMSGDVAPGRVEQGVEIFTSITEGRWEDARRDFAAKMSAALDAEGLARGWTVTAGQIGAYQGMGEPIARRAGDHTIVEIPLRFEAADATGRVVFDEDGKVVGLWIRP
jgi:hypothetical protein